MSAKAAIARRLLNRESVGVLSTHSVDVEGYPFGSIAPYALDYGGEPVVLISDIAQHTRNILANPKVSLTVFELHAVDPQASARITLIGDAEPLGAAETEACDRYSRHFPSTDTYFESHDFSFFRIRLRRARFIGGFGQIFWLEPDALRVPNPFRETERRIVEHMNDDHKQALHRYCRVLRGRDVDDVTMTGIDSEGFDMLADGRKVRIEFDAPIHSDVEARAAFIKLATQ
jgi:putative heme iron utilization protein